jgi:hypothetical protein
MNSGHLELPKQPDSLRHGRYPLGPRDVADIIEFSCGLYEVIHLLQDDIMDLQDRAMTYILFIDKKIDELRATDASPEVMEMFREMSLAFIDLYRDGSLNAKP